MAELAFSGPPVDAPVSGEFGEKGPDYPAEGHRGTDYSCPTGTPVKEQAGGKVEAVHSPGDGWGDGSFGNIVVIDHVGTPWYSGYAHLSRIDVTPGMLLLPGAVVGLSGATGRVTGPHLHHQLTKNASFPADITTCDDPRKYIRAGVDPNVRLANLEAEVTRLKNLMGAYGLLGPDKRTVITGEPALQYANQQQFSALLSGQLAGQRIAELTATVMQLAAGNPDDTLREEIIDGLGDLLSKLEKK